VPPWGFFVDSSAPLNFAPLFVAQETLVSCETHRSHLLRRRQWSCPAVHRCSPAPAAFRHHPLVTRLGEPQLPCPCPADSPIPTGALGEDLVAPWPPARRRETRRRVGSERGGRLGRAPNAPPRHGLAGPQWSWQPGPCADSAQRAKRAANPRALQAVGRM
jgi:hypothetical protein